MAKLIALSAALAATSMLTMAQPVQMWQAKGAGAPPPPPPAPPAPPAAPSFNFDDGLEIPRRAFGAGVGGEKSELAKKLDAVPVGKSFIETITVAADIIDPAARVTNFKAQCKTASNRISGAIRRFRKDNAERNFAIRTVSDEKLGYGVRIWREADSAKA